MMKIIQQTREETLAMYMKLTKHELAEMLANANDAIDRLQQVQLPVPATRIPKFHPHFPTTTWRG